VYPQFVTVMAGINDINQMIGKDPAHPMSDRSDAILATVEDRLTRLVTTLTAERPAATVLLGGCIPYDNGLLNDKLTGRQGRVGLRADRRHGQPVLPGQPLHHRPAIPARHRPGRDRVAEGHDGHWFAGLGDALRRDRRCRPP
jgi:hypothetical protein